VYEATLPTDLNEADAPTDLKDLWIIFVVVLKKLRVQM
jgi:hypothetical protein